MKRVSARSRRSVVVPVKARSRAVLSRVRRSEDLRSRSLTIVGSIFLLFSLVCLSIFMFIKALPSWVLPQNDSIYVLAPSDNSSAGSIWIVVNRPAHRGSLIVNLPYAPDALLSSGIFPDVPMQAWAKLNNTPADTSQALGVAVDVVIEAPEAFTQRAQILSYARKLAWAEIRAGQFTSSWVILAASLQNGTVVELESAEALPTVLDRNDVAVMGDATGCQIAILNNTSQNGLAAAVGQVVEQSGGHVIRLESASALLLDALRDESDTEIRLLQRPDKKEGCDQAATRISSMFSQVTQTEDESVANRLRADLVLVVGEEIKQEALFVTASEQYLPR